MTAPNLETPTSPTPPSGQPGSSSETPPAPVAPEPFRFGATAPAWAQGKSAEEVLGLAQQMEQALQRQQVTPPPPAPAVTGFDNINDADYIDGASAKRMLAALEQRFASQPNPYAQQAIQMAAENALGMARQTYKKEFDRYGPEILAKLSMLPPDQKTLPNIEMVVSMVRGNHVEELAGERARELLGQMDPPTRALGGAGASSIPPTSTGILDRIPEADRAKLVATGLNESTIRAFIEGQGMTPETFIAQYAKRTVGGGQ